jgi:hypothetical protein
MKNRGRQKERGKSLWNRGNLRKGISKSILEKIECWNCGNKVHLKKDYIAPNKQRDGQHDKNKKANVIGDVLQGPLILSLDNTIETWEVYSRDSFQATPHRKYFQYYVQGDFGQVYLCDNEPCQIVGMSKVKIKQKHGNKWLLKEVRHIRDLRKNPISTWKLESEGFISIFTDKAWKLTKGSLVMEKGEKERMNMTILERARSIMMGFPYNPRKML